MSLDELIQNYFATLYKPYAEEINKSIIDGGNELYGEIYYYSVKDILKALKIQKNDHLLDLGSGFGKIVFQSFFTEPLNRVTGIEINEKRHEIAKKIKAKMLEQINIFKNRTLNLMAGDFFNHPFEEVTILYTNSTVFSYDFLCRIGKKINTMLNLQKIATSRKIPNLEHFFITSKIFVQGTWDRTSFYIYERN